VIANIISIGAHWTVKQSYLLLRLCRHGRYSSPRTTYWGSSASSSSHKTPRSSLEERHDDLHQSINNYSNKSDQWHSPPRPNMHSLMEHGKIKRLLSSRISPRRHNPALARTLACHRISEPRQPALSIFPLYTTNAEGMIASTTGAALAFGRAMLLCLGLTSPLI
jgi:hypothetical protein